MRWSATSRDRGDQGQVHDGLPADGGIVDDLIVYRLAEQRYLVVANAPTPRRARRAQRAGTGFDTEVCERGEDWALLAIQGPTHGRDTGADDRHRSRQRPVLRDHGREVAGRPVLLARTGYTGEDGFEIFCAPDDAEPIWHALAEAGGAHGLVPAGLACRDTLRLEAGMPLYGHELRTDLTPYAAGLGRVVMLAKAGDFVGRGALSAQAESRPRAGWWAWCPPGDAPREPGMPCSTR